MRHDAVSYRFCGDGDISGLLALWREADAAPTITDDESSIRACLQHDPGSIVLAIAGDRIVGSVIAAWDGWRGSLYRLAAAPSQRRCGIARELIRRGEERLERRGAARVQAMVESKNEASLGAFARQGWPVQAGMLRLAKNLERR